MEQTQRLQQHFVEDLELLGACIVPLVITLFILFLLNQRAGWRLIGRLTR
jgi:hypothetical protein